jgi:hypothetical protein
MYATKLLRSSDSFGTRTPLGEGGVKSVSISDHTASDLEGTGLIGALSRNFPERTKETQREPQS